RRIDCAAPRLGIEKLANTPEMLIGLAPHGIGLLGIDLGKFFAGGLERQAEMVGEALNIFFGQADQGIGTAIAGAFGTIVPHEGHLMMRGSPIAGSQPNAQGQKPLPPSIRPQPAVIGMAGTYYWGLSGRR